MIDEVKILLGDRVEAYTDEQIGVCCKWALAEVEGYCGRLVAADYELEVAAQMIAIIKLNGLGSEGLASQGYSGVSESYINDYPANIKAILNKKRKIKIL